MILVESEDWHYGRLEVQPAQQDELVNLPEMRQASSVAVTWLCGSTPIAVAGVVEIMPHRGSLWAAISQNAGPHMATFHKMMLRFLNALPYERVEVAVKIGFPAGHRWMPLLGFTLEAPKMEKFGHNKQDYSLYARVR